jgi:hypothetical protein
VALRRSLYSLVVDQRLYIAELEAQNRNQNALIKTEFQVTDVGLSGLLSKVYELTKVLLFTFFFQKKMQLIEKMRGGGVRIAGGGGHGDGDGDGGGNEEQVCCLAAPSSSSPPSRSSLDRPPESKDDGDDDDDAQITRNFPFDSPSQDSREDNNPGRPPASIGLGCCLPMQFDLAAAGDGNYGFFAWLRALFSAS